MNPNTPARRSTRIQSRSGTAQGTAPPPVPVDTVTPASRGRGRGAGGTPATSGARGGGRGRGRGGLGHGTLSPIHSESTSGSEESSALEPELDPILAGNRRDVEFDPHSDDSEDGSGSDISYLPSRQLKDELAWHIVSPSMRPRRQLRENSVDFDRLRDPSTKTRQSRSRSRRTSQSSSRSSSSSRQPLSSNDSAEYINRTLNLQQVRDRERDYSVEYILPAPTMQEVQYQELKEDIRAFFDEWCVAFLERALMDFGRVNPWKWPWYSAKIASLALLLLVGAICSAGPICEHYSWYSLLWKDLKQAPVSRVCLLTAYCLLLVKFGDALIGMKRTVERAIDRNRPYVNFRTLLNAAFRPPSLFGWDVLDLVLEPVLVILLSFGIRVDASVNPDPKRQVVAAFVLHICKWGLLALEDVLVAHLEVPRYPIYLSVLVTAGGHLLWGLRNALIGAFVDEYPKDHAYSSAGNNVHPVHQSEGGINPQQLVSDTTSSVLRAFTVVTRFVTVGV